MRSPLARVYEDVAGARTGSLQPVVERVLGAADDPGSAGWRVRPHEFWCFVDSPDRPCRTQGWKLHVSATAVSAQVVLERATTVLVRHRCAFKFAATVERVIELTSAHCDRGRSGKFITAYPDDDDHLRRVAQELDETTRGLAGPAILSDLPFSQGSLVHLRYGGFSAPVVLGDRGDYHPMLTAPDGSLVIDPRDPWFAPPPWARLPIDPPADHGSDDEHGGPVRLADRYVVSQAIRHANRGGVYLAIDEHTGAEIVLKEARPYTCGDLDGRYAPDFLRHEAEMLRLLDGLDVAPRLIDEFSHQGHAFLAQELIPGESLRAYCDDRIRDDVNDPAFLRATVALVVRIIDVVERVHARGVLLQDLTPGNIMVTPDGRVVLVDLEAAQRIGLPARRAFTRGYAAPERLAATDPVREPTVAFDLYGLGAIVLHLATGIEPVGPAGESPADCVARYLQVAGRDNATVLALAPLICGLAANEPDRRWSTRRSRDFLLGMRPAATVHSRLSTVDYPLATVERILHDGLAHILLTADPQSGWLWPAPAEARHGDPCAVQAGAAGVLGVLTRAADELNDDGLRDGVRTAATWIEERLDREPRILPGLYFGRSGVAWALHDAGRALGDAGLVARALAYSRQIPTTWPEQEICHGLAGAALTHLHLWRATGEPRSAELARVCGDAMVAGLRSRTPVLHWPAGLRTELAGLSGYGFAHGVAGVASVLLALGGAFDVAEYVTIAYTAGLGLCEVAERRGGGAWWAAGSAPDDLPGFGYWCHGSSGVGTFLVRLWAATRERRFLELAEQAAVAVMRDRWRLGPEACHGLAGNGEFLLDLAAATGDARYRRDAHRLFDAIACRAAALEGRLVVPDGGYRDFPVAYNLGSGGVLTFALRLLRGGTRPWMVDDDIASLPPPGAPAA
jgi:tRNA A-37 threonylcarbamoyl transferase component Bud32